MNNSFDVSELKQLTSAEDGMEIYSFTRERDEWEDYINFIRRKVQEIQQRVFTFD